MALNPHTIYRSAAGEPMLYVRTEKRSGADVPEHLFVSTRDRVILTRWLSDEPAEAELIVDTEGRKQANEERWLRLAAEHEIEILLGLLRKACTWLPRERANELRGEYAATRP